MVTLNVFLQSAGLDSSAVGGGGSRSAGVGSVFGGTRVAIVDDLAVRRKVSGDPQWHPRPLVKRLKS